jgi:hypothetical protein
MRIKFCNPEMSTLAATFTSNDCYVWQYPAADAKYCSRGNELHLKFVRMKLTNLFFVITICYIIISSFLLRSHVSSVCQGKKFATLPFSTDHHSWSSARRIEAQRVRVNSKLLPKGNKDKVNRRPESRHSYVLYCYHVVGKWSQQDLAVQSRGYCFFRISSVRYVLMK